MIVYLILAWGTFHFVPWKSIYSKMKLKPNVILCLSFEEDSLFQEQLGYLVSDVINNFKN